LTRQSFVTRSGRGGKIQALRFTITANADYTNHLNLDEFLGTNVIAEIRQEAEAESTPDVSPLSFIAELSDKDKVAILSAADDDVQNIRTAYDMAKQQGNINNLTGWIIYMVGEIQAGRTEPPVEVKRQPPKNRFVNFDQRDIDFAELERLELEQLKAAIR